MLPQSPHDVSRVPPAALPSSYRSKWTLRLLVVLMICFSQPDSPNCLLFIFKSHVTILLAGSLQNLSELSRRSPKQSRRSCSPAYADYNNAPPLERKSSIERSLDLGQLTASTVLNMYLEGQQEGNELIMLSELQVRFECGATASVFAGGGASWCMSWCMAAS